MTIDAPEEEAPRPARGDGELEAASVSDDAEAEARPARRKRKKKRAETSAPIDDGVADDAAPRAAEADDDERDAPARREGVPAFARRFPEDPALDALVVAFEQGDYARVRREAPGLVKATDRAEVRKAARELLRRLEPDPVAVYLLAGAGLLLAFLAIWYWTHPHGAP